MSVRLIAGCGYLGFRVAQRWLELGDEVYALTRSEVRAAELRRAGLRPIVGDVTHPESLTQIPECDSVLHAIGYDRSAAPSKRQVYVDGLQALLKQMKERCRVFVHISSTSVYGQQDGELVDETSPAESTEESGSICRDAEQLVRESGLPASAILRLSGLYGPGRLLSRIESLRTGDPLPGPEHAWLNLIHVDDAAEAVLRATAFINAQSKEYTSSDCRLWLVSDDCPILRGDYYRRLSQLVGAPEPVFRTDQTSRHMRGINKRCLNQRLKQELQVALQFPTINEGLRSACGSL